LNKRAAKRDIKDKPLPTCPGSGFVLRLSPGPRPESVEGPFKSRFWDYKIRRKGKSFIPAENIPVCSTISFADGIHKPLIGVVVVVSVGP
jgi:hypothetical protein